MKKKTPYLDLYKECCKLGKLPSGGLCSCIHEKIGFSNELEFIDLFRPDVIVRLNLPSCFFWGAHSSRTKYEEFYEFNETRQNMLLLIAAMKNEL